MKRVPLLGPTHIAELDAVEKHRELGRIELRAEGLVVEHRQSEATLLEALVRHDEAAVVPAENLHTVPSPRDEDKEMPGVDVFSPASANECSQAVDAVAQVDGLRGEQDANCTRQEQHGQPSAATSSAK